MDMSIVHDHLAEARKHIACVLAYATDTLGAVALQSALLQLEVAQLKLEEEDKKPKQLHLKF